MVNVCDLVKTVEARNLLRCLHSKDEEPNLLNSAKKPELSAKCFGRSLSINFFIGSSPMKFFSDRYVKSTIVSSILINFPPLEITK
ncbi:hypothetical protein D3C76_1635050 [compost metagenome]